MPVLAVGTLGGAFLAGARIADPELIREMIAEGLGAAKAAQLAAGGTIDA